jgi:hypothetical protein
MTLKTKALLRVNSCESDPIPKPGGKSLTPSIGQNFAMLSFVVFEDFPFCERLAVRGSGQRQINRLLFLTFGETGPSRAPCRRRIAPPAPTVEEFLGSANTDLVDRHPNSFALILTPHSNTV